MELLDTIIVILVAIIPVVGAYLGNSWFQRKFALTEKLWEVKYEALASLEKNLTRSINLTTILLYIYDLAFDDQISNESRHLMYQSFSDALYAENDILIENSIKPEHYRPEEFDRKAAYMAYMKLSIPCVCRINSEMRRMYDESAGLNIILDDRSIIHAGYGVPTALLSLLTKANNERIDVDGEMKKIADRMGEFRAKAAKELYDTKISKLKVH